MLQTTQIVHEDITSSVATEEYSKTDLIAAKEKFWHYRITMNPRLTARRVVDLHLETEPITPAGRLSKRLFGPPADWRKVGEVNPGV